MDNSDPERFPSILRFHAGQTASGEVVIPYAAVERKVLPAPVIALTRSLSMQGNVSTRPPETRTLGLQLGYLCSIALHTEGHCTVHRKTWLGLGSRSPALGRPGGTRATAMPQLIPSSSS